MSAAPRRTAPTYGELARVFTRLSLLGFGGPNAHLALMLDEIVEKRGWVTREHFMHIMAITNLLPGPNSSEVAIHIGYTQRGWRGGLVTGVAFFTPTFFIVVALSAVYFRFGAVPVVEEIFWALGPVVVAIILVAGWKLARVAVTDGKLLALAVMGTATTLLLGRWEVVAMAIGGLIGWWLYRAGPSAGGAGPAPLPSSAEPPPGETSPRSRTKAPRQPPSAMRSSPLLIPIAATAVGVGELGRLFALMAWSGSVLFGGGYMLIPLLRPYVVDRYGWLTSAQFVDGIAVSQVVPGPIVTFAAFVGFAVAGVGGAAIAMAGIYLPSFAAVFGVAPFLDRWRSIAGVHAALKGVNAVAAGAILGAALALIRVARPDLLALAILLTALVAQLRFGIAAAWLIVAGLAAGAAKFALGAG